MEINSAKISLNQYISIPYSNTFVMPFTFIIWYWTEKEKTDKLVAAVLLSARKETFIVTW